MGNTVATALFHDWTLDRESIASQCMDIHRNQWISIKSMDVYMDIHRNPWISKWISIEINGYPNGFS